MSFSGIATWPLTTFQTADGNPVANGYLEIRLNTDASGNGEQVCASQITTVQLDEDGSMDSFLLVGNDQLHPSGTYYVCSVYEANGQLVGSHVNVYVTSIG